MKNKEFYVQIYPSVGLTLREMVKRFSEESTFMNEDVFSVIEEFRSQLYYAIAEARDTLPHEGVELHLTSIASAEHIDFFNLPRTEADLHLHIRAAIEHVNTLLENIGCRASLVVNKRVVDAIKVLRLNYRGAEEFHKKFTTLSEFFFLMSHYFGLEYDQLSSTLRATVSDSPPRIWTKIEYLTLIGGIFPQDQYYIEDEIAKHTVKLQERNKAVQKAEELTPEEWRQRLLQDIPSKDWAAVTLPGHATAFSRRLVEMYGVGVPKLVRILGLNVADTKGSPHNNLIRFLELRNFLGL